VANLLDRVITPDDIWDRIIALERRLRLLESFAATANYAPGEGGDTYYELLQEVELTEGDGIDLEGASPEYTINLGMEYPLIFDGTNPPTEYTTLASAISAATSGDVIGLPPGEYSGNHVIPDGVCLAALAIGTVKLTGQITLPNNGTDVDDLPGLSGVRIVRTANDANDLKGVIGPSSGGCRIVNCLISCVQSGAGDAFGVSLESNADIEVKSCHLCTSSGSGLSYGARIEAGYTGNIYVLTSSIPMSTPLSE
jgi:hypothetical protein